LGDSLVLEYDFEEGIGYWACLAARALEQAMNEELAAHGITYQQWQVLAWIALDGEPTQTQLAERLRVEPPTLAGILDRMERNGWVTREADAEDRRRKIVRPTPQVRPVWDKMVACAHRVRARATAGLSTAEIARTRAALSKVLENLHAAEPRRAKVS
jgi:MarR family transcriptional regulator, transcriptional regulator for hemolysin